MSVLLYNVVSQTQGIGNTEPLFDFTANPPKYILIVYYKSDG